MGLEEIDHKDHLEEIKEDTEEIKVVTNTLYL